MFSRILMAISVGLLFGTKLYAEDSPRAEKTFRGGSTWTKDTHNYRFNELEILGVKYHAQEKAIQNCYADGYDVCFIRSSVINECNEEKYFKDGSTVFTPHISCVATAIVIGMKR